MDKDNSAGGLLMKAEEVWRGFNSSGVRIDILKGIHLDIASGETIAIVGASGIGKSTLLHILGTLDRPDKGTVWVQGEEVSGYDNGRLARFRNECIGFIFQFHHLLSEFTAMENVMMPALIRGMSKEKSRSQAEALLTRVGLGERLRHRVNDLSGGEQQRVALARALVLNPLVLLADEPTGNLDKRTSEQVHELLLELNRDFQMTMVVVTHNLELASHMARRVTIVDGRLEELG